MDNMMQDAYSEPPKTKAELGSGGETTYIRFYSISELIDLYGSIF